jgi:hypothetical protein
MSELVMEEVAKNNLVRICFLDISARFDTVSHTYPLRKLEMLGCEESVLKFGGKLS